MSVWWFTVGSHGHGSDMYSCRATYCMKVDWKLDFIRLDFCVHTAQIYSGLCRVQTKKLDLGHQLNESSLWIWPGNKEDTDQFAIWMWELSYRWRSTFTLSRNQSWSDCQCVVVCGYSTCVTELDRTQRILSWCHNGQLVTQKWAVSTESETWIALLSVSSLRAAMEVLNKSDLQLGTKKRFLFV